MHLAELCKHVVNEQSRRPQKVLLQVTNLQCAANTRKLAPKCLHPPLPSLWFEIKGEILLCKYLESLKWRDHQLEEKQRCELKRSNFPSRIHASIYHEHFNLYNTSAAFAERAYLAPIVGAQFLSGLDRSKGVEFSPRNPGILYCSRHSSLSCLSVKEQETALRRCGRRYMWLTVFTLRMKGMAIF